MSELHRRRFGQLQVMVPELFDKENPGTVLYVGACPQRCDYTSDLRAVGHELTALEAWAENIEGMKATRFWSRFAHVVHGDVREVASVKLPHEIYDFVFWWHGPEHVDCSEVASAVRALEKLARRTMVLGSPWGIAPEGSVYGNPHNTHRCYLYYLNYATLGYQVAAIGPKDRLGGNLLAWKRMKR